MFLAMISSMEYVSMSTEVSAMSFEQLGGSVDRSGIRTAFVDGSSCWMNLVVEGAGEMRHGVIEMTGAVGPRWEGVVRRSSEWPYRPACVSGGALVGDAGQCSGVAHQVRGVCSSVCLRQSSSKKGGNDGVRPMAHKRNDWKGKDEALWMSKPISSATNPVHPRASTMAIPNDSVCVNRSMDTGRK